MSWPSTRADLAVGPQQRGEHADGGGLAGPVRAQHAVDRPGADGEVDAVDRARLAEGLHQAGRFDREAVVGGHRAPRVGDITH